MKHWKKFLGLTLLLIAAALPISAQAGSHNSEDVAYRVTGGNI